MSCPFPGMDPWLEDVEVWRGVHARLIAETAEILQPELRKLGYYVDIDERIFIEESERLVYPDLAVIHRPESETRGGAATLVPRSKPVLVSTIHETEWPLRSLQVYATQGRRLVTQIEYISHTNKSLRRGRELYVQKREELQSAGVHVVEIDLLRGENTIVGLSDSALAALRPWDYIVNVIRAGAKQQEVYPVPWRNPLPEIGVPLFPPSPDVALDIQAVFEQVYQHGPYPDRIDYTRSPVPPLSPQDDEWADKLLREAKLR